MNSSAPPATSSPPTTSSPPSPRRCLISLALGTLGAALAAQVVLEQPQLAGGFVSEPVWTAIVQLAGGEFLTQGGSVVGAIIPLVPILIPLVLLSVVTLPSAAALRRSPAGSSFGDRLLIWGTRGWNWWFLPGIWFLAWYAVLLAGWEAGMALVASLLAFTVSIAIAAGQQPHSHLEPPRPRQQPLQTQPLQTRPPHRHVESSPGSSPRWRSIRSSSRH